jgi:hypothetical protein
MAELPFRIVLGAAVIALASCAQQAVKPAPSMPIAATTSAPATASAASNHAQVWPDGITPQILAMARDDGYRSSVRDGKVFFCKTEIPVGSNLPVRHCLDAVHLRWQVEQEQRQRQELNQAGLCDTGKVC